MIELYAILGAIGAALLGALVAYLKGRGDGKTKAETKTLREEKETLGRMADAPQFDSPDAAAEWLRKRKPTGSVQRNRK